MLRHEKLCNRMLRKALPSAWFGVKVTAGDKGTDRQKREKITLEDESEINVLHNAADSRCLIAALNSLHRRPDDWLSYCCAAAADGEILPDGTIIVTLPYAKKKRAR